MKRRHRALLVALVASAVAEFSSPLAVHAATVTIVNDDGAGEGLNDTTPRSPVGGNSGTTLGQQRLIALQAAANLWATNLASSVEIRVQARFDPLTCSSFSATLGVGGALSLSRDFAGAPVAATFYVAALANSLAGVDLNPSSDDIRIQLNSNIDSGCFLGAPNGYYYGLDGNPASGTLDPQPVMRHELAHGLGFSSLVTLSTGAKFLGFDDSYMRNLEDHSTGLLYPAMSDGQRVTASIDTGDLHWAGINVSAASSFLTGGRHPSGHVEVYAPNPQEPGSSVSHFSTSLTPDELMEPMLTANPQMTLTLQLMRDIGWNLAPACGNGQVQGGEQCDDGNTANGDCCSSTCQFEPSTTVCRATAGGCDIAENCTGVSATCPANALRPNGFTCRAAAGICDLAETCNGSSAACPNDAKSTAVCRAAVDVCDVAESCNGSANTCPTDTFQTSITVCRPAAGVCDTAENCTGSSASCPADAKKTSVCRAAAGICDVAESCDGVSNNCPADAMQPSTAVCRIAATTCDATENCTGSSAACPADSFQPSTAVCRASAGVCDVAEHCSGSSSTCPADAKSTAVCRPAVNVCDAAENCDGVGNNCPADSFQPSTAVCRASAGVCDVAEHCSGSTAACPADAFQSTATVCRAAASICDTAENCTGASAACPADAVAASSVVCRPAAGVCDVAENCTGSSGLCPTDSFQPTTTVCRGAAGTCDVAEACTGSSAACPADAKSSAVCRPSTDLCDAAESCDGVGNICPPDLLAPSTTTCRLSAGACDVTERCTGASPACPTDGFLPSTTVCRASVGVCDQSESCTGSSAACPSDAGAADNTPCDNGDGCAADTCQSNVCQPVACPDVDSVVLPLIPKTYTLGAGTAQLVKPLKILVRNPDASDHTIQLSVDASDCPAGVVSDPDFHSSTPTADSTTLVPAGKTVTAKATLTLSSTAFDSFNFKAPSRCTLLFHAASVVAGGSNDPSPSNNTAALELSVIDKNDTEQTSTHEAYVRSSRPALLNIGDSKATASKKITATVGNADYKPLAENPGDTLQLNASTTCPGLSLSVPVCDPVTQTNSILIKGGAIKACSLIVTAAAAQVSTPNKRAPHRCTVTLQAEGPGGLELPPHDHSNNATEVTVDVMDHNDN